MPDIIISFQEYANWNVTVWASDLVLFTAYCKGFRYSGEQSVIEKGYTCLLQNSSSSNLPLSLNHEFQCLVEPLMKELSLLISASNMGMLAQLPIGFLPQEGPLKKIKRRWVCACVCVHVCVCRGVSMEVYVYINDIKGRNKDSNNSSLVGKMLIWSMACGISSKRQVWALLPVLGVVREQSPLAF